MTVSSQREVSLAYCVSVKVSFGKGRWWFMRSLGERRVYDAASSFSITHPAKVPSELSWARTELKLRRLATHLFVSIILIDIIIFVINILKNM